MATVKRLTFLGLSFLTLSACHIVARTPTPQPPIASLPANIPTPTLSTIAPPIVLTNYLENAHIFSLDTFDDPSDWNPGSEISNGQLLLAGLGGNDWYGLSNRASFHQGNGAVINFKFTPGEYFEMYFEQGGWTTNRYKRFGVYVNEDHSNINIFSGRQRREPSPIPGNLSLQPDRWYSFALAVGTAGDFLVVIWDPAYPGESLSYRELISNWNALDWTFRIQVNRGTILFDDFEEIVFDNIK